MLKTIKYREDGSAANPGEFRLYCDVCGDRVHNTQLIAQVCTDCKIQLKEDGRWKEFVTAAWNGESLDRFKIGAAETKAEVKGNA